MTDNIRYTGKALQVIAKSKFSYDDIETSPEIETLHASIRTYLTTHADELFVADQFNQSDRGNFHISYENLVTVDSLKLEEFERIIKEQAFLRNLQLDREETHDGGLTVHWYPREDLNDG